MITVKINSVDAGINTSRVQRFTDLIELIKAAIDPDHMITTITLNGAELEESHWKSSVAQLGDGVLEITTGAPDQFVRERLQGSSEIVRACFMEFRDARKAFQSGQMADGNQALLRAVNTAKSFFEWYASLMQLLPQDKQAAFDINNQVTEISEICKKICQQQLYQSWWALGETLEKELEPKLDKLEDFCRGFKKS